MLFMYDINVSCYPNGHVHVYVCLPYYTKISLRKTTIPFAVTSSPDIKRLFEFARVLPVRLHREASSSLAPLNGNRIAP